MRVGIVREFLKIKITQSPTILMETKLLEILLTIGKQNNLRRSPWSAEVRLPPSSLFIIYCIAILYE